MLLTLFIIIRKLLSVFMSSWSAVQTSSKTALLWLLWLPRCSSLSGATANLQDRARLDISANGVWGGRFEKTFLDVWVFNPHTPSNRNKTPSACYRKHEREKKRAYAQRILEAEHSSFTPLVFSATGGMGREATCFYKPPIITISLASLQPLCG